MARGRVLSVKCQCGQELFRYYKNGRGRLIKCFLDLIDRETVPVRTLPLGSRPKCPKCGRCLGDVRMVRGRPALKLSQGTVRETRT